MTESLLDRVPVIPVVVLHDVAHAVPVARALVEGGVPVIELTLRTPAALDCVEAIAREVPEILVGAGTIVAPGQAKDALSAGAQFLVSPGTTEALSDAMRETGLPHLPGAATVSEALRLLELGYTELKFFPAEASGGTDFLKSIASPVPQVSLLPHRGDHLGQRRVVPHAAERRLRRRLLAHAARRRGGRQLGADHVTGQRDDLPALIRGAQRSFIGPPGRSWATATISATTLRAISPGALPPVSSPAGTCNRASVSSGSSCSSASKTVCARRRLPIIAT